MGWKCPECRNNVYKVSEHAKCPYCNPTTCVVCGRGGTPSEIQQHHIDYDYDITIPVCENCHDGIHHIKGFLEHLNPMEA